MIIFIGIVIFWIMTLIAAGAFILNLKKVNDIYDRNDIEEIRYLLRRNNMADKKTPSEIIKIITDVVTIVFPAIIAVIVALSLPNGDEIVSKTEVVYKIVLIVLSAASSICSVIYNAAQKAIKAE